MKIHKEGHSIIVATLSFLTILNFVLFFYVFESSIIPVIVLIGSLIFFLVILQFFRSPQKNFSRNDNYVICPADGKIVVIEKTVENEYFNDQRVQVSIFMSPTNVHINWYPVSGRIKFLRFHLGKKLVAWHPKASTENERTTVVIEKENKTEIMVRQIAGAVARRIVCYPQENDMVRQCAEMGFIKFGSRVDVFLPTDALLNVDLNQKVRGGETVIAQLA